MINLGTRRWIQFHSMFRYYFLPQAPSLALRSSRKYIETYCLFANTMKYGYASLSSVNFAVLLSNMVIVKMHVLVLKLREAIEGVKPPHLLKESFKGCGGFTLPIASCNFKTNKCILTTIIYMCIYSEDVYTLLLNVIVSKEMIKTFDQILSIGLLNP